MSYKPSGSYHGQFTTQRFDTGVATDADSLPVATATRNGTDDGGFSLTVAKIDTGRYKVAGTIPVGYAPGDVVQISVSASVNSVLGKAVIDLFVVDSKHNADLNDFDPAADHVIVGDLTTSALSEFLLTNTGTTYSSAVAGSVAREIAANAATTWSDAELRQIRSRLGLDGDKTAPTSAGDLPDIKMIVQAGVGE